MFPQLFIPVPAIHLLFMPSYPKKSPHTVPHASNRKIVHLDFRMFPRQAKTMRKIIYPPFMNTEPGLFDETDKTTFPLAVSHSSSTDAMNHQL